MIKIVISSPLMDDLPACLERIEAQQRDLDERLLIVEAELGLPMSIADIMITKETAKRRRWQRFGPRLN
jgi:hypothetical protein